MRPFRSLPLRQAPRKPTSTALVPCETTGIITVYLVCPGDRARYAQLFPQIRITLFYGLSIVEAKPMTAGGWVQFEVPNQRVYTVLADLQGAAQATGWTNQAKETKVLHTVSLLSRECASVYFNLEPLPQPMVTLTSALTDDPRFPPLDIQLSNADKTLRCFFSGARIGAPTNARTVLTHVAALIFGNASLTAAAVMLAQGYGPMMRANQPSRFLAGDYDIELVGGGNDFRLARKKVRVSPSQTTPIEIGVWRLMQPTVVVCSLGSLEAAQPRSAAGVRVQLRHLITNERIDLGTTGPGGATGMQRCLPGSLAVELSTERPVLPLEWVPKTCALAESADPAVEVRVAIQPKLRVVALEDTDGPTSPLCAFIAVSVFGQIGDQRSILQPPRRVQLSLVCDGQPLDLATTVDENGCAAFQLIGCDDGMVATLTCDGFAAQSRIAFNRRNQMTLAIACAPTVTVRSLKGAPLHDLHVRLRGPKPVVDQSPAVDLGKTGGDGRTRPTKCLPGDYDILLELDAPKLELACQPNVWTLRGAADPNVAIDVQMPPMLRAIAVKDADSAVGPCRAVIVVSVVHTIGVDGKTQPRKNRDLKLSLTCDDRPLEATAKLDEEGKAAFLLVGGDDTVAVKLAIDSREKVDKVSLGRKNELELKLVRCNQVDFLLDGGEFFPRLRAGMERVAAAAPDKEKTYVRLAYWGIDIDINLNGKTLEALIREVAAKHPVEINVWRPATKTVKGLRFKDRNKPDKDKNFMIHNDNHVNHMKEKLQHVANVVIIDQKHPQYNLGSMHQKFAIFAVNGKLETLCGGINLERQYLGDVADTCDGLHDTAVAITGPGTVDFEKVFLERWKMEGTAGARGSVCAKAEDQDLADPDKGCDIDVLTTEMEGSTPKKGIQDRVLKLIREAQKYIYVENFTFFDPGVVKALCDRLEQPGNVLRVCVVIPHMIVDAERFNTYLSRIAYVKLCFASSKSDPNCTGWKLMNGEQIALKPVGQRDEWRLVEETGAQPTWTSWWLKAKGWMNLHHLVGPGDKKILLQDIAEFTYTDPSVAKVCFFQPFLGTRPVYLHSKLTIVDQSKLCIGSANFNERSMVYDWELNVQVNDLSEKHDFINGLLSKLFRHYQVFALKEVPDALLDADVGSKRSGEQLEGKFGLIRNTPQGLLATFEQIPKEIRENLGYDDT